MDIKKVVNVVQSVMNQLSGTQYFPVKTEIDPTTGEEVKPQPMVLTATDTAALVDMGEVAKGNPAAAELIYKTMIDTIGKIIIESRSYVAELPSLFVDTIDWGGFVEHVQVGLSDVYEDEMWNPDGFINYNEEGGPEYAQSIAEQEHAFYRPRINAKLYKEAKDISVRLSTVRDQMFTALNNWDEMNKFISALFTSVENTIQLKAQAYAQATVIAAIGKAIKHKHLYSLRTLYNAETGSNIASANEFRNNEAAMKWALAFIANTKDNFRTYTTAFNNGNELTFTPESDERLILLSKFANDAKFGVRADTYHEELIGIGNFEKITAWQAINGNSGKAFDFETVSSISLNNESLNKIGIEGEALTLTNIVGVLYDKWAMGITLDKKKVTTSYTAVNDTWNSFYHSLVNYIVNDNYNICVFTLN